METLKRTATLRAAVAAARSEGRGPIALVPTMGNLHDGHLALLSAARKQAGTVVASIFVNPLQFGAGDDFDRYPRTLARDQALLTEAGVDLLFAPDEQQMYPHGRAITQVIVKQLSEVLCGASRPGHFAGVTTVVAMLLHMVAPDIAVFGAKDYQQLVLIRRMVADLHFPVEIAGVSTVRATDGLALS
ncbi:MAG: pantoate--beta-alanine ligase, partial [Salinisphaera sp.]|nr:pantoate--beta-alanine ligase [Salinisphaera sp.]